MIGADIMGVNKSVMSAELRAMAELIECDNISVKNDEIGMTITVSYNDIEKKLVKLFTWNDIHRLKTTDKINDEMKKIADEFIETNRSK